MEEKPECDGCENEDKQTHDDPCYVCSRNIYTDYMPRRKDLFKRKECMPLIPRMTESKSDKTTFCKCELCTCAKEK